MSPRKEMLTNRLKDLVVSSNAQSMEAFLLVMSNISIDYFWSKDLSLCETRSTIADRGQLE